MWVILKSLNKLLIMKERNSYNNMSSLNNLKRFSYWSKFTKGYT